MNKLKITLDNTIRFHVTPKLHEPLLNAIKPDLNIPNPLHTQAVHFKRSTKNIPEEIKCFEYDKYTHELKLPRGYWSRFLYHLEQTDTSWDVASEMVSTPNCKPLMAEIKLRGYQIPAVQAMQLAEGGVLIAPAGAGKTEMALELLARIGESTLWITHKKDLLTQVIERAISRLGLSKREIGIIGAGKERVGKWLTVGLVQTLNKRNLSEWAQHFGAVMVDECHRTPAFTFRSVVHQFPARYRYGLTATPKRKDELEVLTDLYVGPIIHRIPRAQVEAAGGVVKASLQVIKTDWTSQVYAEYEKAKAAYKHDYDWWILTGQKDEEPREPMLDYNALSDEMTQDPTRNNLIADVLARTSASHTTLALTTRIIHGRTLQTLLEALCPSLKTAVLHHEVSMTKRNEILDAMRDGTLDLLFAVEIPKEGLDIPRLDRLHFMAGGRDAIMVEQATGRIQRPHPDKEDALVTDWVDFDVPTLRTQHYARRKVYQALGMIGRGERIYAISA